MKIVCHGLGIILSQAVIYVMFDYSQFDHIKEVKTWRVMKM